MQASIVQQMTILAHVAVVALALALLIYGIAWYAKRTRIAVVRRQRALFTDQWREKRMAELCEMQRRNVEAMREQPSGHKRTFVMLMALALGGLSAACGDATLTSPTQSDGPVTVFPGGTTTPAATVVALSVSGPSGCVDVSTLPAVVAWTITGLPGGATLEKAYHFDDSVNCASTEQQQRTQNSHLRIVPLSATSVRVEFDRDAERCAGRQQVDVSLNGQVLIGVVLTRKDGKDCGDEDTPPVVVPPPPVPPPTPPAPPRTAPPAPRPPAPAPPAPRPPAPKPPKPEPPTTDCPKQHEHHCEKRHGHPGCRSRACERDGCHRGGHR